MKHVTSKDGTKIAYETTGEGPPLVLVGGAFCDRRARASGTPLAQLLAPHFTVTSFDRRGRGDSTDTLPWSIEREVEDLAALIDVVAGPAGRRASIYGISSGGLLALEALKRELPIASVATYEAPIVLDAKRRPSTDLADELAVLSSSGKRSDAAALFLVRVVGVPPPAIEGMKRAPMWPALESLAHTLSYDVQLAAGAVDLLEHLARARSPVFVIDGGASPPFMREGGAALAKALPNARHDTLEGQTHDVDPARARRRARGAPRDRQLGRFMTRFSCSATASSASSSGSRAISGPPA